jgi:class 3 adenylate cyclase
LIGFAILITANLAHDNPSVKSDSRWTNPWPNSRVLPAGIAALPNQKSNCSGSPAIEPARLVRLRVTNRLLVRRGLKWIMETWLEQDEGSRLPIADGFSIGRGTENQLPLNDERASRRHALIHDRGAQGFWIVDLGSRNGTFVNNRRVQQPARLKDGDAIQIGSTQFIFRRPGMAEPASTRDGVHSQTLMEVRSEECWLLLGDLEGSTQLAQKLDPAQLSLLVTGWLRHCRKLIESSGGTINKFLGDGFLAFWKAGEHPVEKILGCVETLRQRQASGDPRFRVVLHRGRVQFGGVATLGEDNLAGLEVNFAFRMEKLAGSLGEKFLISEAAATPCRGRWALEDAGRHALTGFEGSFRFFRPSAAG